MHCHKLTSAISGGENEGSDGVGADARLRPPPQPAHPPPPLHHVPSLARPLNTL